MKLVGEDVRCELTGYRSQLRLGDDAFLTLEEAREEVVRRLNMRIGRLREELGECEQTLEQVS